MGPIFASQVVKVGIGAPFTLAAIVFVGGAVAIAVQTRRTAAGPTPPGGRVSPSEAADLEADLEAGAIAESQIG